MQLSSGRCTIDQVARLLGVDRRTIHRRLEAEQRSFSDLVDEVRRELVTRYLTEYGRTLAEISSMLGFAAPSGFSRWYRQQFGTTAADDRARHARPGREPTRSR